MVSAAPKNQNDDRFLRIPPKDLGAEHDFLGCLLLDSTILSKISEEVGKIPPEAFASKKNRTIFEAILQRASTSDNFDATVISSDLESTGKLDEAGGRPYVTELTSITGNTNHAVEYARIILALFRRRRLIQTAEAIEELGYTPEGRDAPTLYDAAQELLFNAAAEQSAQTEGPKQMFQVAIGLIEKIKHNLDHNQYMRGVATGFTELDTLTQGLAGGTLNIVAARPGIGKTSFAMNIVENIAMNPEVTKPALVFSLEMPAEALALRMLSTFGRVSSQDLNAGNVTMNQWTSIMRKIQLICIVDTNSETGEKHFFNKLYIDDSADLTPVEIRARARKLYEENKGLSVIMVDYIQLMHSSTRAENRNLEVGEISRSLKLLSKELNVPVIALSQLNREIEGRRDHRPMNSDLRESGSLEQDADLIMFLHRESVYKKPGDEGVDDGKAMLIVSKNRNGALADIELQFQGAYTAFYDRLTPDEVPPFDNF